MTPTKLLIGQILVVFAIMALGVWAATQWAAAMLAYQPELGPPWFTVRRTCLSTGPGRCSPGGFIMRPMRPPVFNKAGALAAASGFLGCGAAVAGSLVARAPVVATSPPTARRAGQAKREVRRAGLLRRRGRVPRHASLAAISGTTGPSMCMAFAPTRSGKGVGLVVPTLLSWTGSAVIHDIKGENWELTAGWRSRFSHCLLFNPTDRPLGPLQSPARGAPRRRRSARRPEYRRHPGRSRRGARAAQPLGEDAATRCSSARSSTSSTPRRRRRSRASRPSSPIPARSFAATLRVMMTTNHLGTADAPLVHPVVASAARELLNKSENERSGVLSTAMSFLGLYRDPTVAAVTSALRLADRRPGRGRAGRSRSIWSFRRPTSRGPSRWSGWCSTRSAAG